MEMESLKDLLVEELKDLYSAENQILKALPKMIKKATSKELKSGFETHLKETEVHVQRLEKIFQELDESPKGKKCKGMEGVIEDGKELMEEDANPEVMDAGLIGAAQHVEHYEMAGYGCVRTYAELWGIITSPACSRRRSTKKKPPTKNSPALRKRSTCKRKKQLRSFIPRQRPCVSAKAERRVFASGFSRPGSAVWFWRLGPLLK